jgi:hypothetical protein
MPRADARRARWEPVRCARCGTAVQVAKFSPQHTSVQWTAASAASCAEFRTALASALECGEAPVESCEALRGSIDDAVASGRLTVCPPSYE